MKKTIRTEGGFTPEQVERFRHESAAFLALLKIPGPQAYSTVTVVDELVCNILEHAQASFLELELKSGLGVVELLFRDDGVAFDPTEQARQQVAMMPGDSEERNLGIYMVVNLGDGLHYERRGHLNELTVVLPMEDRSKAANLVIETVAGDAAGPWRLNLKGTVDVFSFVRLKKALEGICQGQPPAKIAVDLADVDYIASSGWSVLLARRKMSRPLGGDLVVFAMGPELKRVYDAMRVGKLLPACPDFESARRTLMETAP